MMKLSNELKAKLKKRGFTFLFRHVWHCMFGRGADPQEVHEFLVKSVFLEQFWLNKNFPKLKNYSSKDKQMHEIFRWVVRKIRYVRDYRHYKRTEYWQTANETLTHETGDCEDMAILIMSMAAYYGVPIMRLRINAGNVKLSTPYPGHCWLEYLSEEENIWYGIDAAYDPLETRPFKQRIPIANDALYLTRWWGDGVSCLP